MLRTVLTVAAVVVLLATLWAAREALMLIYVSALIAMGFAPLVRVIERPRVAGGRQRVPRVFAILVVYLAIIGGVVLIGLMVVPPLIDQASNLWSSLPRYLDRFQAILIKYKLLTQPVTLQEAVQNAPAGASGSAVGTVLLALWGLIGGIFGVLTLLIFSLHLLLETEGPFQYIPRSRPPPRRDRFR